MFFCCDFAADVWGVIIHVSIIQSDSRTARYTDGKVETTMKNVRVDFLFLS